ncbi:MAG: hypothetical protein A4E59_00635 [Syntrophorhabdus sp. PtaB.Bin027]|nr:MAG: hypothetical protein A4E59_00635 [Syntrophorhabdus sp. PtaB.Bin027]
MWRRAKNTHKVFIGSPFLGYYALKITTASYESIPCDIYLDLIEEIEYFWWIACDAHHYYIGVPFSLCFCIKAIFNFLDTLVQLCLIYLHG